MEFLFDKTDTDTVKQLRKLSEFRTKLEQINSVDDSIALPVPEGAQ